MDTANTHRQFLRISALAGSGLALTACGNQVAQDKTKETKEQDEKGAEVTATEDLMREHGVLRRALLVYAETQQFGKDGYEDAVKQIGDIEGALGFADLSQFAAPPPPKF